MDRIRLSFEWFMQNGWTDPLQGWGGAQGSDYHVQKGNVELRTVDYDSKWHLTSNWKITVEFVDEIELFLKTHGAEIV